MALRLIEIIASEDRRDSVVESIRESWDNESQVWVAPLEGGHVSVRLVIDVEESEAVLDTVAEILGRDDGYRISIFPVAATLPRIAKPGELAGDDAKDEQDGKESARERVAEETEEEQQRRVSREELYAKATDDAALNLRYLVLCGLSAVVASIGLSRGIPAVVIGAMVIAPLLGPNVSLSLATTLGDLALARRAARSLALGLAVALVVSAVAGLILPVDPQVAEIADRTRVGMSDVVLALATGSACILTMASGNTTALVGVMVALSLLPPLSVFGLLLGAGVTRAAVNAGLLCLANLICLNLAGVLTFLVQGIQPHRWWERQAARKATAQAIVGWSVLLCILVAVIAFLPKK